MQENLEQLFDENLEKLLTILQSNNANDDAIDATIKLFHKSELARLVESVPPKFRMLLWRNFNSKQESNIIKDLNKEVQIDLINEMSIDELIRATKNLDLDDMADIIPNLPKSVLHNLLLTLDINRREHLARVLSYSKSSAGGLMNTDIITVRTGITVYTVLRYLRLLKVMPKDTDKIFVVDSNYKFVGSVYVADIITKDPKFDIGPLIEYESTIIDANMSAIDVANMFASRDLISSPVIDNNKQLIGRITIDDVVDVIRTEAEQSVMSMAGLDKDDDLFATVFESAGRRLIWLGVNLITAFIAVMVINLFETTIQAKIALAVLMPVVASMGGIAGTQTLILFTRGIATNKISRINFKWLFSKEAGIGILNGIIWSAIISVIVYLWFDDILLSVVIAIAIIINLFIASISGVILPIMLTKLNIDPALAGGVILTTITDVIGFASFLGLASVLIL